MTGLVLRVGQKEAAAQCWREKAQVDQEGKQAVQYACEGVQDLTQVAARRRGQMEISERERERMCGCQQTVKMVSRLKSVTD